MPVSLDALSRDALVLSPEQRMTLAYRLLVSVEPQPEAGSDAAWAEAIAQRMERFDRGETSAVSADEVFSALREVAADR